MPYIKYPFSLAGCVLLVFFATPVFAQDVSSDANASVSIDANLSAPTGRPGMLPMKPLDFIKARAQQIKQQIPSKEQDAEFGPKARMPMPKDHAASSTEPHRGMRALVMMHGGVIKNRFRLAIDHMNNLLDRINSRLEKISEKDVDTSSVDSLLTKAEDAVHKAEIDATAVADYVAAVDDSSDRATVKVELQAKIKVASDSVKAAHKAVMDTVRALVKLAVDNKDTLKVDAAATTSASVQ